MFARQDRAKTLLTLLVTLMKIPPYFIQRAGNFGWFWSITEAGRFHLCGDFSDGDDDGEAKMFGNFTVLQ